jgi:hypothetical protein
VAVLVVAAALHAAALGPAPGSLGDAALAPPDRVALVERVMAANTGSDDVARALALAHAAAGAPHAPVPPPGAPSAAAAELLSRHGLEPATHAAELASLDALPANVSAALARVVTAFLAFDAATTEMFAHEDLAKLAELGKRLTPAPGLPRLDDPALQAPAALTEDERALFAALRAHQPAILAARATLLDAVPGLRDALAAAPSARATLVAPPALAIDLLGDDDVYETNVALLIDAGGDDVYRNNAGGSNFLLGALPFPVAGLTLPVPAAAALIDLLGNDHYAGPTLEPGQYTGAVNGGGAVGAGFLFDATGDDVYDPIGVALNGGGVLGGVGFLLDAEGNDQYGPPFAANVVANGGAQLAGLGLLVDGLGNDAYYGSIIGVNGGGSLTGVGMIVDGAGDDAYLAVCSAVNGGAMDGGAGAILDLAGDDRYASSYPPYRVFNGANGGAAWGGQGFLFDALGNDVYEGGYRGTNGGAAAGSGFLWDASGDDAYVAQYLGANGEGDSYDGPLGQGFGLMPGTGLLLDGDGHDAFVQDSGACANPAACTVVPKGVGAQLDL